MITMRPSEMENPGGATGAGEVDQNANCYFDNNHFSPENQVVLWHLFWEVGHD